MTAFHLPNLPPEAIADERTLESLAHRAVAMAKAGDTRGALQLTKAARARAHGMELPRGEVQALNAAAIVHLIRGDSISAIAAAMDARDGALRAGDRSLAGHAMVTLHMAAFNLGLRADVVAGLRRCIAAAVDACDRPLEVRGRAALGVVHGDAGLFDAAAFEFARALVTARMHPGATCPARLTSNLANLHRKRAAAQLRMGRHPRAMDECAEAVTLARRACALAAREGFVAIETDALAILGCVRVMEGRVEEGGILLAEAAAVGRAAGLRPALVWILCELGAHLLSAGRLEEAAAAYHEAHDAASTLRPSRKIALACEGLAQVAARRGDAEDAARWRQRAAHEGDEFERVRRGTCAQVEPFLAAA